MTHTPTGAPGARIPGADAAGIRGPARPGRLLALALSLLLLMGGALPASSAEETGDQTAVGLSWRLRSSFENYIGGGEPSDGAVREDGVYRFPLTDFSYDPQTRTTTASFSGAVRYTKWAGYYSECPDVPALDLTFSSPRVVLSPEGSHVYVHAVSRQLGEGHCDPAPDFGEVELADLDAASVTPGASEQRTVWRDIPASLAEGGQQAFAGFYPASSPLDPVTLILPGYSGPVGDQTAALPADAPVFDRGSRYLPEHRNALTEMVYASGDGQRVYFVEKQSGGPRQITPLAAGGLTPLDVPPYVLPTNYANDDGYYDAAADRFFALVPREGQNWLMEVALRDGRWTEQPIHPLPDDPGEGDPLTLTGLGYDEQTHRILAITGFAGPGTSSPYRAHVIDETPQGWSGEDTELPAVPGYEGYVWKQMDSRASDHLMVFMDPQHAVFTPAATGYSEDRMDTRQLPPFVLSVDDERRVTVTPQDQLLYTVGERTRTHDAVHRFSDGTTILYTRRKRTDQGGADDAIRTVRLDGDRLEVVGELSYAQAGLKLPGTLSEDRGLGLVYVFDTTSASMVVLDSPAALASPEAYQRGQVTERVPMPDSVGQTPLDGKYTMAVGADHTVYYPYRDTTATYRQYGVASLDLSGITPAWRDGPEGTLVLDGVDRELTVRASGLPAPAVRWEVRRPGGDFEALPEGSATDAVEDGEHGRRVTASRIAVPGDATEGTVYRAVASNDVGRTEELAVTVQRAEEPVPEPIPTAAPESTSTPAPTPLPEPTGSPASTASPTVSPQPTQDPSVTSGPSLSAEPTADPSAEPTVAPSPTAEPTTDPTGDPSGEPSVPPTVEPTADRSADSSTASGSDPSEQGAPGSTAGPGDGGVGGADVGGENAGAEGRNGSFGLAATGALGILPALVGGATIAIVGALAVLVVGRAARRRRG